MRALAFTYNRFWLGLWGWKVVYTLDQNGIVDYELRRI